MLSTRLSIAVSLALGLPATAQAPLLLEGSIQALASAGPAASLTILGQTVVVGANTAISTPTTTLTVQQLLDPTPYPGRSQPGHVGCSAIVRGKVLAGGNQLVASHVFVEPAENVASGVVTAVAGNALFVNGMPMLLSTDARLPPRPVVNSFGFAIVPSTVAVGAAAALEGWFANGVFHAFAVEITGAATLQTTQPQTSVQRALVRERTPNAQKGDEFDVRGAVTMAHAPVGVTTQSIDVFRVDNGVPTLLGTAVATRDAQFPGFATWRLQGTTPPTPHPVLGSAPLRVRAVNTSPGASAAAAEAPTTPL